MTEDANPDACVVLVLGVGNAMKGDDGVGPHVAALLSGQPILVDSSLTSTVQSIDCGTTPENYTAVVRRLRPGLLVIVDAAEMGLQAGECRIIPPDRAGALGLSTHSMPLSLFVSYVRDLASKIVLVGVQPRSMVFGEGLSPEATAACELLVEVMSQGRTGELPVLD
jgi:hydrogenase 3 maturation protease